MIKPSITETIHIGPQPGPQSAFLESKADFTLFGGSVGCSKTYGVVLDTLKHIDVPGFKAVLFRRTLANAKKPGGLWDTTCAVYRHLKANPLEYKLTWKFPQTPSGAEVRILNFGHDSCKADYQGMQATAVYWDELTEFEEDWVFYMFSRMRGMTGIKTYMKATCNPDQSSWVRKLVDWYVDDEGFPIPERSGVLRYFSRRNDSYQWGNNKEEVLKQNESYMSGINDLKRVYLNNRENMLLKADKNPEEKTNLLVRLEELKDKFTKKIKDLRTPALQEIKSFTFISAKTEDNVIQCEAQPDYISNVSMVGEMERRRLLDGCWNVKAKAGLFFNKDWFDIVDAQDLPIQGKVIRAWDFAATKANKKNKDPDWTVGIKMLKSYKNSAEYFIIGMERFRLSPGERDKRIMQISQSDKRVCDDLGIPYLVRWETEPGASGVSETYRMQGFLSGFDCRGVLTGGRNKETRARPLSIAAEIGNIKILRGDWNNECLDELHMFCDTSSKHDDIVDSMALAYSELCSVYLVANEDNDERASTSTSTLTDGEKVLNRMNAYKELEDDFLNGDGDDID